MESALVGEILFSWKMYGRKRTIDGDVVQEHFPSNGVIYFIYLLPCVGENR